MFESSLNIFFLICLCIFVPSLKADSCKIDNPGKACHHIHVSSDMPPALKQQLLDAHNEIRQSGVFLSAHNGLRVPPYEWDSELEAAAQKWANECQETQDSCRSTGKYKAFEQLVSKTQNNKPFNVPEIVNNWAKQKLYENPIWAAEKNLNRIGCGLKVTKEIHRKGPLGAPIKFEIVTRYLVCNYAVPV